MKIIWAAGTLYAPIFFASGQAKKDFRYNRCRNTSTGEISTIEIFYPITFSKYPIILIGLLYICDRIFFYENNKSK